MKTLNPIGWIIHFTIVLPVIGLVAYSCGSKGIIRTIEWLVKDERN